MCRIEAIKAKNASRAAVAAAAAVGGNDSSQTSAAAGSSGRVFSRHIAIPIPAGGGGGSSTWAGGSGHNTPYGSPNPREPLLDTMTSAALQIMTIPLIWHGFQVGVPGLCRKPCARVGGESGWAGADAHTDAVIATCPQTFCFAELRAACLQAASPVPLGQAALVPCCCPWHVHTSAPCLTSAATAAAASMIADGGGSSRPGSSQR